MKKIILLKLLLIVSSISLAQTHNVFHIGHSLVSPYMPAMIQSFADSTSGINHSYNFCVINGAPLFWHWNNSNTCQGYQASFVDSKVELASGAYDVFVMTEGVPWYTIMPDFYRYADSFHTAALNGNPNIQTYLYESFNCTNTGTPTGCMYDDRDTIPWTTRIRTEIAEWESVADSLNTLHPTAKPVYIIPVGQAFANLKDSVDAGVVPGINNLFTDLFVDDIHPNDTGFYFVALVHYACIYQTSPIGLPSQTYGEWGGAFNPPSAQMALKLQEIAWETVCNYQKSGVKCTPTSIKENPNSGSISTYPNPANDRLNISYSLSEKATSTIVITDINGKEISRKSGINSYKGANRETMELGSLTNGIYILRIIANKEQIVRKFVVSK